MKPVYKIQRYCIHDGPGIRTTVFFQGCPLSCRWCHNPESQAEFKNSLLPAETDQFSIALLKEIEKDAIFFDESGGGVTFSGGEPLFQPVLLLKTMDRCRKAGIHICLDTSGFAAREIFLKAALTADLVLYDIKLMDEKLHRKFTGQDNERILENLKALSETKQAALIRFPLIPGITDAGNNIGRIIAFLKQHTIYRKIHVLAFHKTSAGKYSRLNMKNHVKNMNEPSKNRVEEVRKMFESDGFDAVTGG